MPNDTTKIIQIVQGIQNSVFVKEQIEQIAEQRIQECMSCEHYSPNLKSKGLGILYPYKYCNICKCNMYLKTRSLAAQCPIGEPSRPKFPGIPRWEAVTTDLKLSDHLLDVGMHDEIISYKTDMGKINEHGD